MKPRPRRTSSRQAATSAAIGASAKSCAVKSSTLRPARRFAASTASNAAKRASVSVNGNASDVGTAAGFQALRVRTGILFVMVPILASSGDVLFDVGDRPLTGDL